MSWPLVPLRRLFRIVNGGTPTAEKENWNGSIPWATPIDLGKSGKKISQTARSLTPEGVINGSRTVPAGSIILSTRAPIGYLAQTTTTMAFNQGCRGLVPRADIDIRFFAHQLSSMTSLLQAKGQGTTFLELSSESLSSFTVYNPPFSEQRRIADFLDSEVEKINRLESVRKRQAASISEYYQTAISEYVTPGIVGKEDRDPSWPWLPSGIETGRLGYFAEVQTGVTVDASRAPTEEDVEIPYLRVANVQGEEIDLSEVKTIRIPLSVAKKSMLTPGDVVMTEANGNPDNLGRGSVWNGEIKDIVHQNHIFAIKTKKDSLHPEFLSSLLASTHGRRYFRFTSNQVGIATTSSSKVRSMPIPIVSLERQKEIARECSRLRDSTERALSTLDRQLALLAERRQALITAAVTGQLDGRE